LKPKKFAWRWVSQTFPGQAKIRGSGVTISIDYLKGGGAEGRASTFAWMQTQHVLESNGSFLGDRGNPVGFVPNKARHLTGAAILVFS
jgi:hypothetical protein